MNETTKARNMRLSRGDFKKYLHGSGIDVGAGDDPLIVQHGSVVAWDRENGEAAHLEGCSNSYFDFLYSSHCLEHLADLSVALQNWGRVVRPGGYIYIVIPDYERYEKCCWPSPYNSGHKHSFSLSVTREMVRRHNHWHINLDLRHLLRAVGAEIVETHLEIDNYDWNNGLTDQTWHYPNVLCQICVIARKVE